MQKPIKATAEIDTAYIEPACAACPNLGGLCFCKMKMGKLRAIHLPRELALLLSVPMHLDA